ncbi:hypothetical protein AB0H49_04880 [Nocardia sp. NPDC050713]|uniref:hypothetical protein n=1 Tax=unclassified Nocardia TaxID=2637762 RepID=UPI0033A9B04A
MPAPSRPRALGFDEVDRPVRTERADPRVLPADVRAEAATVSVAAGAVPQVSQYPPDTVPPQPGSAQTSSVVPAECPDFDAVAPVAAGAVPHTVQ